MPIKTAKRTANWQRLRETHLLWLSASLLSLVLFGHSQHWFPPALFGAALTDRASLTALLIITFMSLLSLHTVSNARYPAQSLFLSGIIMGLSLAFAWGINGITCILIFGITPIFKAGFAECTRKA
ncbi:hypothetical protein [Methylovulum psychrotolerans]|uniref:Uncharacterized protein n=1 Tax=Methylovulum psychrotolerans TaxID=1704499 RepID=A0A1Z4C398_9GAMM|nr:hypothetical protein [Methylovulum psychrotolerans]ASF48026.1 hypothetical protein CEK71_19220 [Methylovulum psychrotolerans]